MLKVCKFGGSSLAGAAEFLRVRDLVAADVARRVVVVSAPGRRHPDDQKITDLLYLCHAHLRYGVPCWSFGGAYVTGFSPSATAAACRCRSNRSWNRSTLP